MGNRIYQVLPREDAPHDYDMTLGMVVVAKDESQAVDLAKEAGYQREYQFPLRALEINTEHPGVVMEDYNAG